MDVTNDIIPSNVIYWTLILHVFFALHFFLLHIIEYISSAAHIHYLAHTPLEERFFVVVVIEFVSVITPIQKKQSLSHTHQKCDNLIVCFGRRSFYWSLVFFVFFSSFSLFRSLQLQIYLFHTFYVI